MRCSDERLRAPLTTWTAIVPPPVALAALDCLGRHRRDVRRQARALADGDGERTGFERPAARVAPREVDPVVAGREEPESVLGHAAVGHRPRAPELERGVCERVGRHRHLEVRRLVTAGRVDDRYIDRAAAARAHSGRGQLRAAWPRIAHLGEDGGRLVDEDVRARRLTGPRHVEERAVARTTVDRELGRERGPSCHRPGGDRRKRRRSRFEVDGFCRDLSIDERDRRRHGDAEHRLRADARTSGYGGDLRTSTVSARVRRTDRQLCAARDERSTVRSRL